MTALKISRPLATRLLFEAQKQPDTEVCGFLSALDGHPREIYPVANVADDPARRFEMDPADQIRAMKTMRERGETMLAIYHSHPSAPPEPSVHDLDGLGYPDALYLIISLNIKGVLEMRAWQRQDDRMIEHTLTVMD
ncbi:Mov34/MPN/PAD-1 family protein [Salinisphaera orenii]|uniref:Mov34/MPN/PAD-1 family protein n=1 Tax=Salinisphaera orenii TaxID=856731 RepID=UPI000F4AE209|nr:MULTISPECIES: M67 family metallopeptidase [Salinisphaera]